MSGRPAPLVDDRPDDAPSVELAPEGRWPAVFVDWYDMGIQQVGFEEVPCVKLIWQISARRSDGIRHLVSERYHRTLYRNSALRKMLERWQDARFTEWETRMGVDLSQWFKKPCYVTVTHRPWKPGKPWVKVVAVEPWDFREPRQPLTPEGVRAMRHGAPIWRPGVHPPPEAEDD